VDVAAALDTLPGATALPTRRSRPVLEEGGGERCAAGSGARGTVTRLVNSGSEEQGRALGVAGREERDEGGEEWRNLVSPRREGRDKGGGG
jgi:hypothetical protein